MNASYRNYRNYKRARRKFAFKTYLLLFVWLVLALIQWILISLVDNARDIFKKYYYICFLTFALAVLLFMIFIFSEKLRFIGGLNFVVTFLIVELQIVSLFALVARVFLADLLIFYGICVLLLVVFIVIGAILPENIDLTLDVAILFILGFIFLIVAVFFLMVKFVIPSTSTSSYIIAEIFMSTFMLFFVMYHAQTINGSRFAEMRLNDALLGSLILFHDFLIIYWLTFYWQFSFTPFNKLIEGTTEAALTTETVQEETGEDEYDKEDGEEDTDEDEDGEKKTTNGSAGSSTAAEGSGGNGSGTTKPPDKSTTVADTKTTAATSDAIETTTAEVQADQEYM